MSDIDVAQQPSRFRDRGRSFLRQPQLQSCFEPMVQHREKPLQASTGAGPDNQDDCSAPPLRARYERQQRTPWCKRFLCNSSTTRKTAISASLMGSPSTGWIRSKRHHLAEIARRPRNLARCAPACMGRCLGRRFVPPSGDIRRHYPEAGCRRLPVRRRMSLRARGNEREIGNSCS